MPLYDVRCTALTDMVLRVDVEANSAEEAAAKVRADQLEHQDSGDWEFPDNHPEVYPGTFEVECVSNQEADEPDLEFPVVTGKELRDLFLSKLLPAKPDTGQDSDIDPSVLVWAVQAELLRQRTEHSALKIGSPLLAADVDAGLIVFAVLAQGAHLLRPKEATAGGWAPPEAPPVSPYDCASASADMLGEALP